ncbi:hypothetical protein NM208_g1810 [Fusarium decemcellulare]|uniref:Uncharacterized protein n=1 Tax=Fusarium decemcellulare TaxID=57161 RepID=A0ACC1SV22_9HYPO|nr:hypothetical protein NM208_g1810 [Fusarium decemcellulare]
MSDFEFYRYTPSVTAAAVIAGMFGSSMSLHLYQCVRTRTKHMVPLLVGALCEAVGFAARAVSAEEAPDYTLGPYIIQSLLVLVAPVIIAASIYMIFGRIIIVTDGGSRSLIRERLLTRIFVTGDVIAFMVQSTGASNYITIGGLILQLLVFGFFMIISVVFYLRISRQPTRRSQNALNPWRKHLFVLYLSSLLIMIRSVFRLVEYVQGEDGYLLGSEVWLYVFDAALILVVVVLFNLFHPSQMRGMMGEKDKFDLTQMTTAPQSGNLYEEPRENNTAVVV